jgi:hypothetical protein
MNLDPPASSTCAGDTLAVPKLLCEVSDALLPLRNLASSVDWPFLRGAQPYVSRKVLHFTDMASAFSTFKDHQDAVKCVTSLVCPFPVVVLSA